MKTKIINFEELKELTGEVMDCFKGYDQLEVDLCLSTIKKVFKFKEQELLDKANVEVKDKVIDKLKEMLK